MRVRQRVAARGTSDQEAFGAIFPAQPRELERICGVHVSEWDVERCCQDGVSGDGEGPGGRQAEFGHCSGTPDVCDEDEPAGRGCYAPTAVSSQAVGESTR